MPPEAFCWGGVPQVYGAHGLLLKENWSLYNQSRNCVHIIGVELILSEGWTLTGLSRVSDLVCGIHGQDLKVQSWRAGCLVWEPQGDISALCGWL